MPKRIIAFIILFSFLFLCACQPTPDHEVIINKGDGEQAGMSTTAAPKPDSTGEGEPMLYKETRAGIPEHVNAEEQPRDRVVVVIDADVNFDREGIFPVIEVEAKETWSDPSFVKKLISLVSPGATVYYEWERTKDEVKVELEAALSYHGQADSIMEMDESYIKSLEQEFRNAPIEALKEKVNIDKPLETGRFYYIEDTDGNLGMLNNGVHVNSGAYNASAYCWFYYTSELTEKEVSEAGSRSASFEEAKAKADDLIAALCTEEFMLAGADEMVGHLINKYEWSGKYWKLNYVRKIGSTASVDERKLMSKAFFYNQGSYTTVGTPWPAPETIRVFVGPEGIASVTWVGLSKTTAVIEEDVPFCDFDTIKEQIISQLGFMYVPRPGEIVDSNGNETVRSVNVSKIELVYGLISEKDKPKNGVYLPMWEVEFTLSDDNSAAGEIQIYLSAIDGSLLEPRIEIKDGDTSQQWDPKQHGGSHGGGGSR